MRYGGSIEDLDDLMKVSIELDGKLHQRSIARQETRQGGRFTGRVGYGYSQPSRRRDSWGQDVQGDPMELDVLTPQNRERGRNPRSRKCYSCGKEGHIARNCRSKNQVQRPHLNVLQAKLPEDTNTAETESISSWEEVTYWVSDEQNSEEYLQRENEKWNKIAGDLKCQFEPTSQGKPMTNQRYLSEWARKYP